MDANYIRFVERALRPDATSVIRLGVASHNLFDVALAHLLAEQRGCADALDIEMLQGMAPAQARAIKADVGTVVLYTPVVAAKDFDVAVSYLIRRLEENAAEQNFLHAMFAATRKGSDALADQERRFRHAAATAPQVATGPRRTTERAPVTDHFANTADSDPALPATRDWARAAVSASPAALTSPVLRSAADVDRVVATAVAASGGWAGRPLAERADLLREAARQLEARRGALVTVMAAEGGKTVAEADPEVSEAIDFARYYADRAEDLGRVPGARFTCDQVVLVTPPWNFPVAIPMGSVLAALAAGAAVVIKPAHPTPGCVEVAVAALHEAGIPHDVLQVVRAGDRETGRALVSHRDVETVILTGSSETGAMFADWRAGHPRGPRVYGETSGKNALVVTPAADLDLAVADLVRSAFGHAGQKCSAASLGILVGSVATSKRFRRQLVDAVRSLKVGYPADLQVTMGPIIEPPQGKLLRALTKLDPGESWLVTPKQLDESGRLWSPGLKTGVRPGSFFHLTEVFGPVLGLMQAKNLAEAIEWQNATSFGLTGGLHSLDADEIAQWAEQVAVGNAYINRHITGAIVQRQSFGGWKDSVLGPGAKAGGPNYVAQFGQWSADGPVERGNAPSPRVSALLNTLSPLVGDETERAWLLAAARSDAHAWRTEFGVAHDESALRVESNVFRYRSAPQVIVRAEPDARPAHVVRLLLAAELAGTEVALSLAPEFVAALPVATTGALDQARRQLEPIWRVESAGELASRAAAGRIRVVGDPAEVIGVFGATKATLLTGEVLASGRRELLPFLREQVVSRTLHRFGHLPPDR